MHARHVREAVGAVVWPVAVRAFDGALWPPENSVLVSAQTIDRDPALDFNVSADYYAKLKAGPASLRATLYVTLYQKPPKCFYRWPARDRTWHWGLFRSATIAE